MRPPRRPSHVDAPRIGRRQWLALAAASGVIPAFMLYRVGWSLLALPPLLMLVGLVQLAYCDLTRRLLPKTLVYALGASGRHERRGRRRRRARLGEAGARHARRVGASSLSSSSST